MSHSTDTFLGQLLLPLRGVVDFFSPPHAAAKATPYAASRAASPVWSASVSSAPRLAKTPALPSAPQRPHATPMLQPAGIRLQPSASAQPSASKSTKIGTQLVGKQLMGRVPQALTHDAQVLRSRRAQDGRIVISGRMRDVCAELDRLCAEPA